MELAAQIASTFQLGGVQGPLVPTAVGWGGHNKVFRLVTADGAWAIKQLGRHLPADCDSAFAIETTAWKGGVPMAPPVATAEGGCWAEIEGTFFRCHGWIDGRAKENGETSAAEAEAMGHIVARLHGLAIPCPLPDRVSPAGDAERWRTLAAGGHRRHCGWAGTIDDQIERLARIASGPTPLELGADELVGSHRDLNAHNVLFTDAALRLVDWDAAGPAWPRWERVDFSVRWAERAGGRYDESVLSAFLRGYLDGGGELDEGDSSVLTAAPAALVPWVLENLELAVEAPSEEQDLLAAALVAALLARPETARRREEVFSRCFARL